MPLLNEIDILYPVRQALENGDAFEVTAWTESGHKFQGPLWLPNRNAPSSAQPTYALCIQTKGGDVYVRVSSICALSVSM